MKTVFEIYPKVEEYAHLSLLHNISFLKTVAFHRALPPVIAFDKQYVQIGEELLKEDTFNPYANLYMGVFYDANHMEAEAKFHYEQIVTASNFSPFWYTNEAERWLAVH